MRLKIGYRGIILLGWDIIVYLKDKHLSLTIELKNNKIEYNHIENMKCLNPFKCSILSK